MNFVEKAGLKIVHRLIQKGHKAFYAGGCVRDKILGLEFKDIDIATSAQPQELISLFKKTIPVGIQFGVIIVLMDNIPFEVTTFRKDISYKDGRHPDSVEFTDEKEDVLRRDFTINGMLYDPITNEIIDYVGGQKDLEQKVIRAIGDPFTRFKEDKLRMIRAIRFAARLSYAIEEKTWHAIKTLYQEISQVSSERIRDELLKILTESNPKKGIELLDESGLLKLIIPEIMNLKGVEQPKEYHPEGDVYTHTLLLLENLNAPSKELALAALLHDVGKPYTMTQEDRIRFNGHDRVGAEISRQICERLKLSNKETDHVVELVDQHMKFMNVQKMRTSKLKRFFRLEHFQDHLELHRLDCLASHRKLDHYHFCKEKWLEFSSEAETLTPPKIIDGKDLIHLGFKPGPKFSTILDEVENAQLEGAIHSKEEAIQFVEKQFSHLKEI